MRRVVPLLAAVVCAGLFASTVSAIQDPQPAPAPPATCDAAAIDPDSYRLTTEAQALNVLRPREPWWEPYGLWKNPREIGDVNAASLRLAERAIELDDRNLLAHGYLARQRVVMAIDARKAEESWARVLDNGGAITWTATLPKVDPRAFFVLAFDRSGIRIFRFTQLAGEVPERFGFQEFPEPEQVDFWRALGGCLPAAAAPEAAIPWSQVREIRTSTRALRFELTSPAAIASDVRSPRRDDSIDVILHRRSGVDPRFAMGPFGPRPYWGWGGPDPEAYLLRVRQMLQGLSHGPHGSHLETAASCQPCTNFAS